MNDAARTARRLFSDEWTAFSKTARERVGLDHGVISKIHGAEEEDVERKEVRHVLKVRVVGLLLIVIGSMLNGHGVALARLFS